MPKDWRDDIREILERDASHPAKRSRLQRRNRLDKSRVTANWLEPLGDWVSRRFSTTNEMLITAASLVVIALLLYATPLRSIAAVLALSGAVTFLLGILRAIFDRRRSFGTPNVRRPAVWRGQVIELAERQSGPSLRDRLRMWWHQRD